MTRECTLIVFVKEPRVGEVKTRLGVAVGMEQAAEIYRACAEEVFGVARQVAEGGVRIVASYAPGSNAERIRKWINSPSFDVAEQEGVTLGDRMRHAIARAMGEGALRVLVVGSDIPEIDREVLEEAYRQLETHDVVLGPSPDGGYYVIGMRSPVKDLFANIHWSTSTVFEETRSLAAALHLSVSILPVRADIDREEDFHAYQKRLQERGLSGREHHMRRG